MKKKSLTLMASLLTTAALSSSSFAGLISYYNFNEGSGSVAHDSVRGASGNAPIYGNYSWASGVSGGALHFDGGYGGAVAPMVSGITGGFTLSAWVKYNDFSYYGTVAKNWSTGSTGAFHLGLEDTQPVFSSYVQAGNVSAVYGSRMNMGEWYNVLFTYDGTQQSLYLNGTLQGTDPMSGTLYTDFPWIGFGNKPASDGTPANSFLNGTLDEISLYNVALTAGQVASLYTDGTQGIGANGQPAGGGTSPVPEPSQVAASLLLLAGIGFFFIRQRKAAFAA